jgi:hypothetical protein
VSRTGTFTWEIIAAWSQEAVAMPETNAFPHSGSYSLRFCGAPGACSPSSGGNMAANPSSIDNGRVRAIARCSPAQSPTDHWSPR